MAPLVLLDRMWPMLFGYDFFISYRREDAETYAESLNVGLRRRGFVCFLDREQTVGGVELTPALQRALRRSRALVVILTPGVLHSPWVRDEVASFLHRRDRLLPINVNGFLTQTTFSEEWVSQLQRRAWINERAAAVAAGHPSDDIIPEIRKNYDRRRVRTLARLLGVALLTALSLGGTYVGRGYLEDTRQRELVYTDIRRELRDTRTLLRFIVAAAQGFKPGRAVPPAPPSPLFNRYAEPDVIGVLENFDLARPVLVGIGHIGFEPVLTPGDTGSALRMIVRAAKQIRDQMNAYKQERLSLASARVIGGLNRVAGHEVLALLANADGKMRNFHRVEDNERRRFVLIGNPGLMRKEQYLNFISVLNDLSTLIAPN